MGTDDALLASKMVDTGDAGHPLSQPGSGLPSARELEFMLTQMRRMRRKNRVADEGEFALAGTAREKDDIRYRMLWGDWLYRRDVDRLSGRTSSKTREAERRVISQVDMMNEIYGIQVPYPQPLEEGDPILGSGTPIQERERVRVGPLPGRSVILRPGEEGF